MVEEQQKSAENQEHELIEDLEQEITELKNKLQHLSQTEDVIPVSEHLSDQYMTPHAAGFLLSPAVDLLISIQLYKHQELV